MHKLKYQKSKTTGLEDIGIRKSEFVAITQFLRSNHKNSRN